MDERMEPANSDEGTIGIDRGTADVASGIVQSDATPNQTVAVAPNSADSYQSSAEFFNSLWLSAFAIVLLFIFVLMLSIFLFRKNRKFKEDTRDKHKTSRLSIIKYRRIHHEARIKYYEFLRDEIKREDDITNQRLTWAMAIQGFLIGSITANLSFGWDLNAKIPLAIIFSKYALFLVIGLSGFTFAFITYLGVLGARRSIDYTKTLWEERNDAWALYPDYVPQPCGREKAFTFGRYYALGIPVAFMIMWLTEIVIFLYILYIAN